MTDDVVGATLNPTLLLLIRTQNQSADMSGEQREVVTGNVSCVSVWAVCCRQQMVIEDYEKPLTSRSRITRTSSSSSLRDQISPDLTGDVKFYQKMSPISPARPRRRRPNGTTSQSNGNGAAKRYFQTDQLQHIQMVHL